MNLKFRQIRKMAEQYRTWYPDATLRRAVNEANVAYELYREAEAELTLEMTFGDDK